MHAQYGKADTVTRALYKQAGNYLAKLRKDAGLTQLQVSRALGHDYPTLISQVERGLARLPPKDIAKLAALFGMKSSELAQELLSYYDPYMYEALFDNPHKERQHHAGHRTK